MKTLTNLIKLGSKVSVYVPATVDVNKEVDNTKYVDKVASELAKFFGGSTYTPAVGCWMSDTEGLVRERTTVVYAYATEADLSAHIEEVIDLCEWIKEEMKQEAVSLEVNGELYFI